MIRFLIAAVLMLAAIDSGRAQDQVPAPAKPPMRVPSPPPLELPELPEPPPTWILTMMFYGDSPVLREIGNIPSKQECIAMAEDFISGSITSARSRRLCAHSDALNIAKLPELLGR